MILHENKRIIFLRAETGENGWFLPGCCTTVGSGTGNVSNVVIENDMIFFLAGDKKNLVCPVLIDTKQLTPEELEQVNYYIDLYLYDLI